MVYTYASAQQADTIVQRTRQSKHAKPAKPPACYIGLSTGMDNPSGYFGLDFNIRLAKYLTLDAGAGPSTWGNKLYLGAKCYLKEAQRGWALSGGVTFSSGQENVNLRLNTIYSNLEKVSLSLNPDENAFIAVYHYWTLGRKYNRFFVDFGKSIALQPPHFHEKIGDPLTSDSKQRVRNLCPGEFIGGLMVGCGFSFGLYRK